jgi:hypothetical protein
MFTITYAFSDGSRNTMTTEDYSQARKWWGIFSKTEVMEDVGIQEMIMTDSKGQVISAKFGPMKLAA